MQCSDLEVEAGSACTWCLAGCRSAGHMGGSASAQGAYYSHSSPHLVYGSQSPAGKNKQNVLLINLFYKEIKYIKTNSQYNLSSHYKWDITDLCLGRGSFLFLGFLLARLRGNSRYILLWFHRLHHLLLWFLGDRCQGFFLFRRQGKWLQVIATRFGLQVGVVEEVTLLLFKFGDLSVHAYCTKPAPGERRGVFETLKNIPGRNLLFGGYLKALTENTVVLVTLSLSQLFNFKMTLYSVKSQFK